jgi:UTP--glucose-1-phosphate uridylyltransferase
MTNKITKAIFPIAGMGTRFLPATKAIPKEMLTVLDKPVLEWAVIEAAKSGIEQMIFVTSSRKSAIMEHFDRSVLLEDLLKKKKKIKELESINIQHSLGSFSFVNQSEPKGLGHAVLCASKLINKNENFVVILPDDIIMSKFPITKQLIDLSKKNNYASVIALEAVDKKKVYKYGVIEYSKNQGKVYNIINLVEKPKVSEAPSNLTIVGRYLLNEKIFTYLKKMKSGHNKEIQLTDSLNELIEEPGLLGLEFDGERFDCGSKLGFIEANLKFGLNDKDIKTELKKIIGRI